MKDIYPEMNNPQKPCGWKHQRWCAGGQVDGSCHLLFNSFCFTTWQQILSTFVLNIISSTKPSIVNSKCGCECSENRVSPRWTTNERLMLSYIFL